MTRPEAFQLLGLNDDASEDQIRAKFKELARDLHPDKGGDPLAMAQLYTAREFALGRANSLALVPIDDVRSLVGREVSAVASRYESRERRQHSENRIKEHHTSPLRVARNTSGTLALLAGAFAIFKSDLLPLLQHEASPWLNIMLITAVVTAGVFFLVASWWVERLKTAVDDFSDALTDKNSYVDMMVRILEASDRKGTLWSKDELETFIRRWGNSVRDHTRPRSGIFRFLIPPEPDLDSPYRNPIVTARLAMARLLPEHDLAELLVARGLETQLLEETEEYGEPGGFVNRYHLLVPTDERLKRRR